MKRGLLNLDTNKYRTLCFVDMADLRSSNCSQSRFGTFYSFNIGNMSMASSLLLHF